MGKFIVSVAEAKRRFSDLVNQVVYHKKRFVIARRGKPMVGLIPAAELHGLPQKAAAPKGFLTLVGLWEDFVNLEEVIQDIYHQREREPSRPVPPLE